MLDKQKDGKVNRGFFGIGILNAKNTMNVGTLWRSANIFGASYMYVIGKRYKRQSSDTLKSDRHIPLYEYNCFEDFRNNLPKAVILTAIETPELATNKEPIKLEDYKHPQQCCYLLGSEDNGLPKEILRKCHHHIYIKSSRCLNVSTTGSIVMWSRDTGR